MRATSSEDWRVTVSSKSRGTRVWGVLSLGLGAMLVIAAGGTVLTDRGDSPVAAVFVVVGGLFGAGGVHFLRMAGKPMFEIDPTGVTYHPLTTSPGRRSASHGNTSEASGVWSRREWASTRAGTCTSTTNNRRSGTGSRAGTISWRDGLLVILSSLAHAALPLMLSSIPEDELFPLLEDLSKRHGFALESVG